jgi:hypothetical protein
VEGARHSKPIAAILYWISAPPSAFLAAVSFQLGSSRTIIVALLALAILAIVAVIGREIYRAVHPPNKPARKRKRRNF